jgi:aminoglycoside phosphotransferase
MFLLWEMCILNLDDCPKVTDVSALTNVYELHLSQFRGVSLSGLQNVVVLFLNHARNVTDISMLRKVKILEVEFCPISRYQGLHNIRALSAGGSRGYDGHHCYGFLDRSSPSRI